MEYQLLLTDNHFRAKVKGIIDHSAIVLEKKMAIINKELLSLKNEYLDELIKCNLINTVNEFLENSKHFDKLKLSDPCNNKLLATNTKVLEYINGFSSISNGRGTGTPRAFKRDPKNVSLPGLYRKGEKSVIPNKKQIINASISIQNGKLKNDVKKRLNFKGSLESFRKDQNNQRILY